MKKTIAITVLLGVLSPFFVTADNSNTMKKINYAILKPDDMKKNNVEFVDGIPFLQSPLWQPEIDGSHHGFGDVYIMAESGFASKCLSNLNIKADSFYLLGCLNSVDIAHPAWGGGDGLRNFFIGDTAGEITIGYADGKIDTIPMVFGYTAWWDSNYKASPEPFRSDPEVKKQLDDALCVANGAEGYANAHKNYYLKIKLRDEPIKWIAFRDNPKRTGYFQIDGLTFSGIDEKTISKKFLIKSGNQLPADKISWLKNHTIDSKNPYPETRKKAIKKLREKFYGSLSDINEKTLAETPTEITETNFPGPKISFSGSPIATLLTRIYYENANQILGRIDEDGMVHESGAKSDFFNGFGGWAPGIQPFYTCAYTRFRGLTAIGHLGFEEKVNQSIKFFDKWMMYFPESFPEIQLGGKPVPGHATVIANKPHEYFDELTKVGWRTKYKTRDFGNPENDGHGLLMITRWRAWKKQGMTKKWIDDRWEAINEAAEYIPWCLDNPELSFSTNGLLHNESEGGMMKQSMYCDFVCYLGLLGYAEMAEATGKKEKAERWKKQAQRLFDAMMDYYPENIEPWGDVWNPKKNACFGYTHSTLAPACIGMDFWGYDAMNKMSDDWAERTRRTYKMQLKRNKPDFAATAGIGYGQCYITQAALILDEMKDAEKMVDWMARVCFAPRLPHPYRVPEGSIISEDGTTWRRWGDLGNLYQLVDVVQTILLITGIDDINPAELKLMPRLPADLPEMEIEDLPVRTMSDGKSEIVNISLEMKKKKNVIEFNFSNDKPVDKVKLRIGPFSLLSESVEVKLNNKKFHTKLEKSGDSKWAWVKVDNVNKGFRCQVDATKTGMLCK